MTGQRCCLSYIGSLHHRGSLCSGHMYIHICLRQNWRPQGEAWVPDWSESAVQGGGKLKRWRLVRRSQSWACICCSSHPPRACVCVQGELERQGAELGEVRGALERCEMAFGFMRRSLAGFTCSASQSCDALGAALNEMEG